MFLLPSKLLEIISPFMSQFVFKLVLYSLTKWDAAKISFPSIVFVMCQVPCS